MKVEARLSLTPDELKLLSGMALYGLWCAGAAGKAAPLVATNLHRYTERARRTLEPDSAAAGVLKSLATKLRDAADMLEAANFKGEVFTS